MGDAAATDEIWAVWRRIVRILPVARMPYEWFFSPSIWTMWGLDVVTGLLKNRSTKRILAELASLDVERLRRIYALAHLNHRRHEAISRWTAIGFVTLPASAALTLSQLSPHTLEMIADTRGLMSWYVILAEVAVVVTFYLLSAWRARQLLTIVELAFITRGVRLNADEGAEEPASDGLGAPLGA